MPRNITCRLCFSFFWVKGPAADATDAAALRLIVQSWWWWLVFFSFFFVTEHRWNEIDREKPCPNATLSTINPTWTDPGPNPGLRGERPATTRLSHGAAYTQVVTYTQYLLSNYIDDCWLLFLKDEIQGKGFYYTHALRIPGHYCWYRLTDDGSSTLWLVISNYYYFWSNPQERMRIDSDIAKTVSYASERVSTAWTKSSAFCNDVVNCYDYKNIQCWW